MINWIIAKYGMIGRMLFWGWKMRNNYDFDASTIYEVLYLKLDRVHKCMKEDGHLKWNNDHDSNLMRKLTEAKMLCKKLYEDDYSHNYEAFSKKYNRKGQDFLSLFRSDLYPDAKIIDDRLYNFMIKKAFASDSKETLNDRQRLYFLLDKYTDHWWD